MIMRRIRIAFIIVGLTIPLCLGLGHDVKHIESLRSQVNIFLKAWLVDEKIDNAVELFDPIAFSNLNILSADCIGDIKAGEKAIDQKIRNFLKEYLPVQKPKALRDILVLNEEMIEDNKQPINLPSKDGFYLFSGADAQWMAPENNKEFDYIRARVDLSHCVICISLIKFDLDAVGCMYTIWCRTGKSWRIIHTNLICV